jgi:hypothetical protein
MAGRPGELALLDLIVGEGRGPRRNAVFATWLILRAALDQQPPAVVTERNQARRLSAVRKRLASLTLPDQLRKSLYDILEILAAPDQTDVTAQLEDLKNAVRTSVNTKAAEAIQQAIDALANPDTTPSL